MSWYGTDREAEDLAAIAKNTPIGTEIVNPNSPEFADQVETLKQEGHSDKIMAIFMDAVAVCDAIAYRTFDDDYIGAGVAQEVLTAAIHGKQIFRILDLTRDKGPMLFEQAGLRAAFGPRVLTISQTRDRIKRGFM
jgi:hypothetical protein